jgi:hypothetical protein
MCDAMFSRCLQFVGALGVYNVVVGRTSEICFVMFLLVLNLCFYAWIMGSVSGELFRSSSAGVSQCRC